MISKQLIIEWTSELQQKFQDTMPALDSKYPEVFIIENQDELPFAKNAVNDKIKLTKIDFLISSSAFVKYLHGINEDVILIIRDRVPDNITEFAVEYYSELGKFYVVRTETKKRYELCDEPDENIDEYDEEYYEEMNDKFSNDEFTRYVGYCVWLSFISSVISNIVLQNIQPNSDDVFSPKALNEYRLGKYLAWAVNNKDSISTIPEDLQPLISEAVEILDTQLKKEKFWIPDEDTLWNLGDLHCEIDFTRAAYHFEVLKRKIEAERRKERKKIQKAKKQSHKAQKQARKKNRRK